MLFVDPCWITFQIINTRNFAFAEHRYGAFITQIWPLIGTFLGLNLKAILILYSASFYLFYGFVAYLVGRIWKEKELSILFILYLTIFVSDVYYWPNNEVHQGIGWMFLFLGYYTFCLKKPKKPIYTHFLLFTLLFLALSSHLIVSIGIVFLWLYIHNILYPSPRRLLANRSFVVYSLLIAIMIFVRYYLSKDSWYDGAKLEAVKLLSFQSILTSFSNGGSKTFLELVFHKYYQSLLVLAIGMFYLLKNRLFIQFLLVIIFSLSYYSLICLTYPNTYNRDLLFYMESEWMGLSIIWAAPFVFHVIPCIKPSVVFPALLFVYAVSILNIASSFSYFNNRLNKLQQVVSWLHKNEVNKALFIQKDASAQQDFIMTWGLPVESLFLSSITNSNQPAITFKLVDSNFNTNEQSTDSFYSCFSTESIQNIDTNFIKIDKVNSYKKFIWNQ